MAAENITAICDLSKRIAMALEDRLWEVRQTSQLIECIENLQKEICHE